MEDAMSRNAHDFLAGFQQAAVLTRTVMAKPPAHTTAAAYLEDVAHLHADSDDLTRRGLAVGCLSALGRSR
jgi:hypothetical protein